MLNLMLKLLDVNDIQKCFDIVLIDEQISIEESKLSTFFLVFDLFRQFVENFDDDVLKSRELYSLFFHFNRRIFKIVEHDEMNKKLKSKWKNVKEEDEEIVRKRAKKNNRRIDRSTKILYVISSFSIVKDFVVKFLAWKFIWLFHDFWSFVFSKIFDLWSYWWRSRITTNEKNWKLIIISWIVFELIVD